MGWVNIAWPTSNGQMGEDRTMVRYDRVVPEGRDPTNPAISAEDDPSVGVIIDGFAGRSDYATYETMMAHRPDWRAVKPWLWRKYPDDQEPGYPFYSLGDLILGGHIKDKVSPRLTGNEIYRQPLPLP